MRLSLNNKISIIISGSYNNPNLLNRFFKKLGSIVFLFQAVEERMRTFFIELLDIEDKEEVYNLILSEISFLGLSNKLLNLFKERYPNDKEFEKLINKIQEIETTRNTYIHSMYYLLPDKIYRTKHKRGKKNSKMDCEENMNLKSLDNLVNDLLNIYDLLEIYRYKKIMNEVD